MMKKFHRIHIVYLVTLLGLGFITIEETMAEFSLDHFKCYNARSQRRTPPGQSFPRFQLPAEVFLTDQFEENKETRVLKTDNFTFCNPVDKDDGGIVNNTDHLTCFEIEDVEEEPEFKERDVEVENQFGFDNLRVVEPEPRKPQTLCVPSSKTVLNGENGNDGIPNGNENDNNGFNIDHFKCYNVVNTPKTPRFERQNVFLTDQFEMKDTRVIRPVMLCNPVDKDNGGIVNNTDHLTCYEIEDVRTRPRQPRFTKRDVFVQNQFGSENLTVFMPVTLCVPSLKTVLE